jgi:hypothetical protein
MNQDNTSRPASLNTAGIIFGMILMFIIVHIGFGATYIRHFPKFQGYNRVHHIHGALMASWVMLLVVQPVLIYSGRFSAHRFMGKLTYAIAPLMIISMFFIARLNYQAGIGESTSAEVMAMQSITWMQIMLFVMFYSLAIYFRKNTYYHMRFMIGTGIIMIGPAIGRILFTYFPDASDALIPLYIKTALAAALFFSDLIKRKNWLPYLMVLSAFIFADTVFHARYSDAWQAVGKFIVNTFYN